MIAGLEQVGIELIAMLIHLLKSKIHRATVTGGNVGYEGSLTISRDLVELAGFREYERILCGNMTNGERFETYIILGRKGTGEIILNGATAHLGRKGDQLTIMGFAVVDIRRAKGWKPRVIVLGKGNTVTTQKAT
jgi:aspartate 1-decarboxylase